MSALIWFALWAVLLFLMMRHGCGAHVLGHGHRGTSGGTENGADNLRWVPPKSAVDPVCGKTVRPENAKPSVHDGSVYYFCSRECREQFEAAPEIHLRQPPAIEGPAEGAANG